MPYETKHTDTPSFQSKNTNSATLSHQTLGFLLQETSDYLLLEDGFRIILEQVATWSYATKH